MTEQELAEIAKRNGQCLVIANVSQAYDPLIESVIREDVPRLLAEVRSLRSLWIFGEQGKYWTHPRERLCASVDIGPHVHYGRNVILPVTEWSEPATGRDPERQSG